MTRDALFTYGLVLFSVIILAGVIAFAFVEGRKRLERAKAKLAQDSGEDESPTRLCLTVRTNSRVYGLSVLNPEVNGVVLDAATAKALAPAQLLDRLNTGEISIYIQRMIAEYKKAQDTLCQPAPPKFLEFDSGSRITLIPVADIVDVRLFLEVDSGEDESV